MFVALLSCRPCTAALTPSKHSRFVLAALLPCCPCAAALTSSKHCRFVLAALLPCRLNTTSLALLRLDRDLILVSAFGGTALAFGCFSAVVIIAKRREFLYFGGLLSSALSILMWLRFASSIFGSTATFSFELYFGLMIFLGYVVFDTQSIIERAHHGDVDYVKLDLVLFIDFVGILVRILIIMPDIVAPGVNILVAWSLKSPSTLLPRLDNNSVNWNFQSGTSMLCPHVSGL